MRGCPLLQATALGLTPGRRVRDESVGSGRRNPAGKEDSELLHPLARHRLADSQARRDIAIGAVLHEALDEQGAHVLGQLAEQQPDGRERLVGGEPFVRVDSRHRQAPRIGLAMDVDRPIVERRCTPRVAILVDREVAQDAAVEGTDFPQRLVVRRDEVEYSHGRCRDQILSTSAVPPAQ